MNPINLNPEKPELYFTYDFHRSFELDKVGKLLALNHENYVRISDHLSILLIKMLNYDGDLSLRIYEEGVENNELDSITTFESIGYFSPNNMNYDIKKNQSKDALFIKHNGASTGSWLSWDSVEEIRINYPEKKIILDASTSFPLFPIDFNIIDGLYFSSGHCFGMPDNTRYLLFKNSITTNIKESKIRNTTTMEHLWLFGKILEDFSNKGIDQIRRETTYKAAVIYHAIDSNPHLHNNVISDSRSVTTIGFKADKEIQNFLREHGYLVGKYAFQDLETLYVIANYPTYSKEQFEKLADHLALFKPLNSSL